MSNTTILELNGHCSLYDALSHNADTLSTGGRIGLHPLMKSECLRNLYNMSHD